MSSLHHTTRFGDKGKDVRIRAVVILCTAAMAIVMVRLFFLMVVQHGFYTALAAGSHEVSAQLFPKRGLVYIQDSRTKEEYPLAMNRDYFLVYADTRHIPDDQTVVDVGEKIAPFFQYGEEQKKELFSKLSKKDDPYEPIEQKVDEKVVDQLKALDLPGIGFIRRSYRYYPEKTLGAHVIGFVGKDETGGDVGRYGIEGYWQKELAGSGGFFEGLKSAQGRWIPLAGKLFEPAKDGADILLTIDRTLQHKACERLRQGFVEYGATSAALIIMDPKTGAIRAMCSLPDFDPNAYNKIDSVNVYNNTAIFTPYEPGSIFKPLTMAAAMNEGLVNPDTLFHDTGSREVGCSKPIQNANLRSYGTQSMTGVLENSINTGMAYVSELLGKRRLSQYMEQFGFGVKEGIELDTEVEGNISSVTTEKKEGADCYTATAAFGQGITVTPLQMATAMSAIANGGVLMKPYIVEEMRYSDGSKEIVRPEELRRILSPRTTSLVRGMMTSVVDRGQSKNARLEKYYIGGKTGTAQIPGPGGYSEETNHSFIGFGPADDPRFVMLIKYEKPQRKFADSTAAPVFADIAQFVLQYYEVPPGR
ncbi:MAG TPA: penicillin-binding protein 2 [Candidatus Kapabacteria bacterium]|nr:penicillin-binding protein 2 [Candidatus Kapabacteria bacterium]